MRGVRSPFPARRALDQELAVAAAEFESLAERLGQDPPGDWLARAREYLARASRAGGWTGSGLAWRHLHAARREALAAHEAAGELGDRARVILERSRADLDGWRLAAVEAMLAVGEASLGAVSQAFDVLDDGLAEDRAVDFAYQRQSWGLAAAAFFLSGGLGALIWKGYRCAPAGDPPAGPPVDCFAHAPVALDEWQLMISVLLAGMLGGAVSGAYELLRLRPRGGDPTNLVAGWLTFPRVVIGGAAALAVFTLLISGLLNISPPSPTMALAIAFAAGFSERLLTGAVGRVSA